jgi:hypothetical protein
MFLSASNVSKDLAEILRTTKYVSMEKTSSIFKSCLFAFLTHAYIILQAFFFQLSHSNTVITSIEGALVNLTIFKLLNFQLSSKGKDIGFVVRGC